MKLYVSDIEESYKHAIIGNMVNSGTSYLLLHIIQRCRACAFNEKSRFYLWFFIVHTICINIVLIVDFYQSTHNEEVKYIHNEIFNNIPHFIKNRLCFDCLQVGFVVYKNKVVIFKREFIPSIPDYMIPVYFIKKLIHRSFYK